MAMPKLIQRSNIAEVNDTIKMITVIYEKSDLSSDPYLPTMFNRLKVQSQQLLSAIIQRKAKSSLEEMDHLRDQIVRSISHLLNGYLYHPDKDVQSAAQTVVAVFDTFGIAMISKSFSIESALIVSMLKQFSETTIAESITHLPGLSQLIEDLTTSQSEFEIARISYASEKAAQSEKESATAIKKEIIKTVNDTIVTYLRAMAQVDEPRFGEFASIIGQIIADNNSAVKKRSARLHLELLVNVPNELNSANRKS